MEIDVAPGNQVDLAVGAYLSTNCEIDVASAGIGCANIGGDADSTTGRAAGHPHSGFRHSDWQQGRIWTGAATASRTHVITDASKGINIGTRV